MSITVGNQTFTTSMPDVDGLVNVVCVTDPRLSFSVDLGTDRLNQLAIRYFDRIMLSTPSREHRHEQARAPGPLIEGGYIGSMKFTNVRFSFGIYWSQDNNDKIIITDILNNTILEKQGLTIGTQELRNFLCENFPLRMRINTSSIHDQYEAIMSVANQEYGHFIDEVSYHEIETHSGIVPQITRSVDEMINEMHRQYNIDIEAITNHYINEPQERERTDIPPPYKESPEFVDIPPPSYDETFA